MSSFSLCNSAYPRIPSPLPNTPSARSHSSSSLSPYPTSPHCSISPHSSPPRSWTTDLSRVFCHFSTLPYKSSSFFRHFQCRNHLLLHFSTNLYRWCFWFFSLWVVRSRWESLPKICQKSFSFCAAGKCNSYLQEGYFSRIRTRCCHYWRPFCRLHSALPLQVRQNSSHCCIWGFEGIIFTFLWAFKFREKILFRNPSSSPRTLKFLYRAHLSPSPTFFCLPIITSSLPHQRTDSKASPPLPAFPCSPESATLELGLGTVLHFEEVNLWGG